MNTDELIVALRQDAFIGDGAAFPDFDDFRLLTELNDALMTTFERAISQAREGYWLKHLDYATTVGRSKYRIPPRAVTGGLESVWLADGSNKFVKLQEVSETHAQSYERAQGQQGEVLKFVVRSDQVVLLPSPSQTYTLRLKYYLRPSRLVPVQIAGRVDIVNHATRQITTSGGTPVNQDTGSPITTGDPIDIVHSNGWHELSLVNATPNLATLPLITIPGTDDIEIEVGDYVRYADQTDWPCLPDDYHRPLATIAAATVMDQLHMGAKADKAMQRADGQIQRFIDHLSSRVKSEAKVLKAPVSILQAGRNMRGFFGWR